MHGQKNIKFCTSLERLRMNSITVTGLKACYLTETKGYSKVFAIENVRWRQNVGNVV